MKPDTQESTSIVAFLYTDSVCVCVCMYVCVFVCVVCWGHCGFTAYTEMTSLSQS